MAIIELLTAGEQKFRQLKVIEEEYKKKINRYTSFSVNSIKIKNVKDEKKLIQLEGEKILEKIDSKDFLAALDRNGEEMSSLEFSKFISKTISGGVKKVIFVIGSAQGLSKNIISRADKVISFSKMTYAHDIFKVLFLEQLYRAFTIIKRQKYHR